MYMKQPMRGQLPQQAHIMGQSNTNSYYNVAPKQTVIHGKLSSCAVLKKRCNFDKDRSSVNGLYSFIGHMLK